MDMLRSDPNVLGILMVLAVHFFFNPPLMGGVTSYRFPALACVNINYTVILWIYVEFYM